MRIRLIIVTSALFLVFSLSACRKLWISSPNIYPQDYLSVISPVEDTQIKLNNPVSPGVVVKELDKEEEAHKLVENTKFFSFAAHSGDITALALSNDGLAVYSAGADGNIFYSYLVFADATRRDLATASLHIESLLSSPRSVFALSLSPDGRYLAIGQFSIVSVFDLQERRIIAELTRVEGRITALAWDPESKIIALGRAGGDVFIWPFQDEWIEAENRLDKIEHYAVGSSPIVKIIFHPAGRIFFAAEKSGVITAWRLLRTESEIGLRDEDEVITDRRKEGRKRVMVGQTGAPLEDIFLNEERDMIIAATADGRILWWKVRGLQQVQTINAGSDAVSSLGSYRRRDGKFILVTTQRSQVVRFWCDIYTDKKAQEQMFLETPKLQNEELSQENINKFALLAKTPVFSSPVSFVAHIPRSNIIWIAQKTGNLLAFDAEMLDNLPYCY